MLTLGIETIVILLLIMGVVSAFGGYVVAHERQRRSGGGKSAAELRSELDEYKENVNEHFQTTAGLLHDMTEQYRAVYEHMASGAQNLCDPETAQSQIESLRAGLLPSAPSAPVAGIVADQVADEDVDEELTAAGNSSGETAAAGANDGDIPEPSAGDRESAEGAVDKGLAADAGTAPDETVSEAAASAGAETHAATQTATETEDPEGEEEKR
ncbi:MAG: YhcB family protein [Gammaproteobacteria bacterium]|jgi:uncharacterized membrane-anchored protein YhcB (DUF1043 family)